MVVKGLLGGFLTKSTKQPVAWCDHSPEDARAYEDGVA
jgi:hypothetical protein